MSLRLPPPVVGIKLAMCEKEIVERVGLFLDKNVVIENRRTKTGKLVYKVDIARRDQVPIVLRRILPYIVGEKAKQTILEHLKICDQYDRWSANRGAKKAARLAARIKAQKKAREAREEPGDAS
jgi:hypothetical protein